MGQQGICAESTLLRLKDGRQLCFQLFGAEGGSPAYFFHGFPGCRLQAELIHQQAEVEGICLVAFDRPGFGRSEYDPARTLAGISADVVELADHLGHSRFLAIGVSCGGAYALSCAHDLPDRISHVALFAGMGPMDIPEIRKGQLPILTAMFSLARVSPVFIVPMLAMDWLMFQTNPQRAVRMLGKMLTQPDQDLLKRDSAVADIFGRSLAEAYRQGLRGPMREAALIGRKRPYDLADISAPVTVYQPAHDRHVPVEMGKYIASSVQNGRFQLCESDGHLSVLMSKFSSFARDFLSSPNHSPQGRRP